MQCAERHRLQCAERHSRNAEQKPVWRLWKERLNHDSTCIDDYCRLYVPGDGELCFGRSVPPLRCESKVLRSSAGSALLCAAYAFVLCSGRADLLRPIGTGGPQLLCPGRPELLCADCTRLLCSGCRSGTGRAV